MFDWGAGRVLGRQRLSVAADEQLALMLLLWRRIESQQKSSRRAAPKEPNSATPIWPKQILLRKLQTSTALGHYKL